MMLYTLRNKNNFPAALEWCRTNICNKDRKIGEYKQFTYSTLNFDVGTGINIVFKFNEYAESEFLMFKLMGF